ncbi:MAG TPA: TrkA C-terminal domain-containing protein, partial [Methylomirabilota bacterium]|nr:TrkA C-terminal domain-containing protein [Methylomirabilota bacterium]
MAINVVVVSALFAGAAVALHALTPTGSSGRLFEGDLAALAWLAAALLSLPFLVATWRKTEAIVMILAEAALPRGSHGHDDPAVDLARQRLLRMLLVLASATLGVWLLLVSAPLLPPWPVFLALVVAVGVLMRVLWRAMVRVYGRMQARIEEILREAPAQPAGARAALVELIQEKHPWDARVTEIVLPEGAAAAGRTIGELGVRRATGASVVGLHRGGLHLVNPGPAVPLFPGDSLVLIGGETELAAARALLLAERGEAAAAEGLEAVEIVTVEVPGGSPLDGVAVADTPLRARFGVTLVGLQRGERRMPSPAGDLEIRQGDLLVLLGLPERVADARAWIEGA